MKTFNSERVLLSMIAPFANIARFLGGGDRGGTSLHGLRLVLVVGTAFLGCSEPLTPPSPIPTPADRIAQSVLDGTHGGNKHFFFLAPIVSNVGAFTGVSDPDQGPTVAVCEWTQDKGGSCGAIVAQFGRGDGSNPGDIVYDPTAEHYKVNWKTDQCLDGPCTLDVSKIYRLRVLIGAYELGHADLDVVGNGSELKNVQTGEYIGLVEGRTLPIKFRIEKGAVSVASPGAAVKVGSEGGVVMNEEGSVSLEFQAGSLLSEKAITIAPVTEPMLGDDEWSKPVELGPDGSVFDKPVMLTLKFDGEKFPPGVPYDLLAIAVWMGDSWEVVPNSVVNEIDNTVTAPVSHFSIYRVLLGYAKPAAGLEPKQVAIGGATTVFTTTTAYDVRPGSYCRWVSTRVRFLFWWTTRSRLTCYYYSQPYSYTPVGMRVYYFAVDPAWRPVAPDWNLHKEYVLPNGGVVWGYLPQDPYRPVNPTPSTLAKFDAPGYGIVQPGLVFGHAGVAVSPPVRGLAVGRVHIAAQTGTQLNWAWYLDVVCPKPSRIDLQPTGRRMNVRSTQQFTVLLYDLSNNIITCHKLNWQTADTRIATVDANGLVTAHAPGQTTLNVAVEGLISASTGITVDADTYTVAFSAAPVAGGPRNIYTQVTGSPDATRVNFTVNSADNQSPRWSPNAQRILFTSGRSGSWELWAMNATAGATASQISRAGGLTAYGDFSPVNPSEIVFMRGYRIWKMNMDAPNPDATAVQITSTPFDENHPRWSPDGRWITWIRQPRAGTDVWVMNASNPAQAYQVTNLGDYARHPSWSPDGTKIVFSRLYDIYVADVIDNSDPANPVVRALADIRITRLTFDGGYNDMPVWSPDGRKILWSAEPRTALGQLDLLMMNADGSGAVERVTATTDTNEAWPAFKPFTP